LQDEDISQDGDRQLGQINTVNLSSSWQEQRVGFLNVVF
jgi:hypothetical protein